MVLGGAAPGYSSGQALAALEQVADEILARAGMRSIKAVLKNTRLAGSPNGFRIRIIDGISGAGRIV